MNELRLTEKYINLLQTISNLGPDSYLDNKSNYNNVSYLRTMLGKHNIITANRIGYRVTDEGRKRAREILKRVPQI